MLRHGVTQPRRQPIHTASLRRSRYKHSFTTPPSNADQRHETIDVGLSPRRSVVTDSHACATICKNAARAAARRMQKTKRRTKMQSQMRRSARQRAYAGMQSVRVRSRAIAGDK